MTDGAYGSTTVAVEKSQSEIRKLLATHSSTRFAFGEDVDDGGVRWAALSFEHSGFQVRIRVPLKPPDAGDVARRAQRSRTKTRSQIEFEANEQEARRIWRVMWWNLKARLVAVDEGVETFAQAFLPHLVNPATDRTVYEDLADYGRIDLEGTIMLGLPERTG